jgi:hypothetical protein
MEFDSIELCVDPKKIPEGVHTIFNFNLPYAIPIADGLYEIAVGGKVAELVLKRIQRETVEGFKGKGIIQLKFDKYGRSSFSSISLKFPWKIDCEEIGRTPLLLSDYPPRKKAKQTVLRFLNRFIDTVRTITNEYWVERARYQDILSYEVFYWDGKNMIPGAKMLMDSGTGGMKINSKAPFQVESDMLDEINKVLLKELRLDPSKILFLNAKDACLQEDFRLAIIESVAALEIVLYNFIRIQGSNLELEEKDLEDMIVKVGLTGNITLIMRMLAKDLEQVDVGVLSRCKGAIKIRNKILHEGLLDIASTETEKQIIAIERMIEYLKKITKQVQETT